MIIRCEICGQPFDPRTHTGGFHCDGGVDQTFAAGMRVESFSRRTAVKTVAAEEYGRVEMRT